MQNDSDRTDSLAAAVSDAAGDRRALELRGSGSKAFYGRRARGEPLNIAEHRGVISYEPTELVLTARAGTPLADIEALLADNGQMLAFEPPQFGGAGTLGGAVAAGLSGPRRPFTGAVRDMVLGIRLINGRGEAMRFGGEVMKNVAGYDVSRLATGAMGTLGVILDVSLKVLPRPETETSVRLELPWSALYARIERWLRAGIPVSAAIHDGTSACIRLSGTVSGVKQGLAEIGGDRLDEGARFWASWRDQSHPFFGAALQTPLWRIALPPGRAPEGLPGDLAADWAGQQLWLRSDEHPEHIRELVEAVGGHATWFRGGNRDGEVFHPLRLTLARLNQRVKAAFDPQGIFNPGRLYPE
ncbi:glycolate oxidase subunit GlcE [Arhodomonas sp. AD133]|uniref:glycolate oxidase subunit GlcE n=1 Tax=Arhodomonas sp. AD133 TaxID=3415009 RepID=UPI003EBEFFEA